MKVSMKAQLKEAKAQLKEANERAERSNRRLKRCMNLLSKDRAKLRKLSVGYTKGAKIQGQQMVSEAGSESGSAGILEGSTGSLNEITGGWDRKARLLEEVTAELSKEMNARSYRGIGLMKEEATSYGSEEEGTQKKKWKVVRLPDSTTESVLQNPSPPPFPHIAAWKLALLPKSTQELYKKSRDLADMLEQYHEERYLQAFYKGYIEVVVTNDEDNTEE